MVAIIATIIPIKTPPVMQKYSSVFNAAQIIPQHTAAAVTAAKHLIKFLIFNSFFWFVVVPTRRNASA